MSFGRFTAKTITSIVTFVSLNADAFACPLCHSGTGQQVRAGIFAEDFFYNLFVAAAPFPVLAVIVTLIHFGPPSFRRQRKDPGQI